MKLKILAAILAGLLLGGLLVGVLWTQLRAGPEEELASRIFSTDGRTASRLLNLVRQVDEGVPFSTEQIDFLISHVRQNADHADTAVGLLGRHLDNPYRRDERVALLEQIAQKDPPVPGSMIAMLVLARNQHPSARSIVQQALSGPHYEHEWDRQFLQNILLEIDSPASSR